MGGDHGGKQQRPADEQRSTPATVCLAARERPQDERGDAERADREADAHRVRAERAGREQRRRRDQQAIGREVGELRRGQRDEGPREQTGLADRR